MKTNETWFTGLGEPYRSQSLQNSKVENTLERKHESIRNALMLAFVWKNTQQGADYWRELYNKLPNEKS